MIRALVVDDSLVVRSILTRLFSEAEGVEVVGTAVDGRVALEKVELLRPDLVTMDVEMPHMDGISTVRHLRQAGHRMPIVMLSTLTERGASATIDALAAGASDYVAKPSGAGNLAASVSQLSAELLPKVYALAGTKPTSQPAAAKHTPVRRPRPRQTGTVKMVVVGASTGGPAALARLVGDLAEPLPVPVLVTQHMPAVFTRQLADRLARDGRVPVHEAAADQDIVAGSVYIAPGGKHLEVTARPGGWSAKISDAPPVNYCKPSVDVMFDSAARAVGPQHLLAVMLTGMGSDGARAARDIADAGGRVIAQDEATSVVWGMPGATVRVGAAHEVLPLDDIGHAVARALKGQK